MRDEGDGRIPENDAAEDASLMARIGQGDERAFATLVNRHLGRTVRLAQRIIYSKADAEDVAQDAFTKLWRHAPNWKGPDEGGAKFTTWFHRVVVNLCIDHKRRQRTVNMEHMPEEADEGNDGYTHMQRKVKIRRVAEAVEALPERQRTALVMCFYEGESNADAAEIMGISVKALESLLVRARRTLRDELGSELSVELGES